MKWYSTPGKVHQTWLEYGPRVQDLRQANAYVRQCMSDMGTEFGIANYHDIVTEYFAGSSHDDVSRHMTQDKFLYPLALQVPGVLHIIDWIVKDTVHKLPFWPVWQKQAKTLLQFMHGRSHRQLVIELIKGRATDPEEAERLLAGAKLAQLGTTRFAHWRWRTLYEAVKDLMRIQEATKFVMSTLKAPAKDLALRNASAANDIKAIGTDERFWSGATAIHHIISPLMQFASWVSGCDCHEDEIIAGHAVNCAMQGCRAPRLSQKLKQIIESIDARRSALYPGQFGTISPTDLFSALSQSLYGLKTKFHWVDELPWLVWQALKAQSCVICICSYILFSTTPCSEILVCSLPIFPMVYFYVPDM